MANSRLGMDTKSITEGALMAALTAVLAMAGIYIPPLAPVVMLIWTLPVVVICLRRGMRAGAATMAVAGFVILVIATPTLAIEMLLRSAGPALIIGYGLQRQWKSEHTILFTGIAAFIGLTASFALSFIIMGVDFDGFFSVDPNAIDEIVKMFSDYGFMDQFQMSAPEMADYISAMFVMLKHLFPAILLIAGLSTAFTNFIAANIVLKKLKIPLPPVTKLSTFRLPFGFVFAFILGMGLAVVGGSVLPGIPAAARFGQNIMLVCVACYFFQGLGLIFHFIGKAEPSTRKFWKFSLVLVIFVTFLYFFSIVGFIGVADALFDFRKQGFFAVKK